MKHIDCITLVDKSQVLRLCKIQGLLGLMDGETEGSIKLTLECNKPTNFNPFFGKINLG